MTDVMDCFQNPKLASKVFLKPIHLVDLAVIPDKKLITHLSVAFLQIIQKHIAARDQQMD